MHTENDDPAANPIVAALNGIFKQPNDLPDNVLSFPTREGMGDRSGGVSVSRQVRRNEERNENKKRAQILTRIEQIAPDLYNDATLTEEQKIAAFDRLVRANSPATHGELQEIVRSTLTMYDKLAGEVLRGLVTNQALLRLLVNNGVISEDDFKEQARQQIEWNSFVNNILRAHGTVPLRDLLLQVRQWNDNPANVLKVGAHHIDLARHLLSDEGMTLEEKLLTAQEMELPEVLLQSLRDEAYNQYNPPSVSAENPASLPSDAQADEPTTA